MRSCLHSSLRSFAPQFEGLSLSVTICKQLIIAKKQEELEKQVATIKQYTEVAKWTFNGDRATGYGMATGSPISGWWKDHIRSEKGEYVWKCNNDALEHYKSIIKQYSIYPFPYLLIAQCLKKQGDSSWKGYAEEGFRHAKGTVQISGHYVDHNWAYFKLKELLEEDAKRQ